MHTCSIGTGFQKEKFREKFVQFFLSRNARKQSDGQV